MTTVPENAPAVETERETTQAIAKLKFAFADGAQRFSAFSVRGYWQPKLGIGVCIFRYRDPPRWWIGFGRELVGFKDNLVVEINPPTRGIRKDFQGVVASRNGKQWLMHRGRMQLSGQRISSEQSFAVSDHPTAQVGFSDGSQATCFVVACLDDSPVQIRGAVTAFVRECQRIRDHYEWGDVGASEEADIEQAESDDEEEGNPETEGTYLTPPRSAATVRRRHATVWNLLKTQVAALGFRSTNKRVGRFGPDLRTFGPHRVLFEIKTTIFASAVQQALGQLMLYEQALGTPHTKVLVLPRGLPSAMRRSVEALGVKLVEYKWIKKRAKFDIAGIRKMLG